jgi:hypothetical protein
MRAYSQHEVIGHIMVFAEETKRQAEKCWHENGDVQALIERRVEELKRLRALAETAQ